MRLLTRRTIRRLSRPSLALALVIAQAMAAFGYPILRPKAGGPCGVACGCESGPGAPRCCCMPAQLLPPTPRTDDCGKCGPAADTCCCSKPVEPEPRACPKCREKGSSVTPSAKASGSTPLVRWIPAFQASKCRGESPQGLMAEIPAVPPVVAPQAIARLAPAGTISTADFHFSSIILPTLDPPPRCG